MFNSLTCRLKRVATLVVTSLALVHVVSINEHARLSALAQAVQKKRPVVTIEADTGKLPTQVSEMRDAILAAARSGRIDELIVPIQWNELKPDFGDIDAAKPVAAWKKLSIDGEGREILAILLDILESP